jgi:hypothetical protein
MVSGPGSFAPRFKAPAIDLYRFSEGARAVAGAGIGTETFRKWVRLRAATYGQRALLYP